jgi:hypothetical protein
MYVCGRKCMVNHVSFAGPLVDLKLVFNQLHFAPIFAFTGDSLDLIRMAIIIAAQQACLRCRDWFLSAWRLESFGERLGKIKENY